MTGCVAERRVQRAARQALDVLALGRRDAVDVSRGRMLGSEGFLASVAIICPDP